MAWMAHHGIPLPRQYAEGYPQSFECAVCPADTNPARLAFLRRHYPVEHLASLRLLREACAPAIEHADEIRVTLWDARTMERVRQLEDRSARAFRKTGRVEEI
jgi:hypothetical protein